MNKIYTLGPEGTYGHQVALGIRYGLNDHFDDADITLVESHQRIFAQVDSDHDMTTGIVAIENSIGGLVAEVISCWIDREVFPALCVFGEAFVPIHHHLMVRPGTKMSDVRKVFSHSQAISQCRRSLQQKGFMGVPVSSTAEGARMVAQSDEPVAAIASKFAARHFNLVIVTENLADSGDNTTRFHLVGRRRHSAPTGNDRMAFVFGVPNSPGSLMHALGTIGHLGVNMSSIHSIPIGRMSEYVFYCECDCHESDVQGSVIVADLCKNASYLRLLGSYPKGEKPTPE